MTTLLALPRAALFTVKRERVQRVDGLEEELFHFFFNSFFSSAFCCFCRQGASCLALFGLSERCWVIRDDIYFLTESAC